MSLLRVGDWVRVNPLYKKAQTGVGHILDANYADDPPHLILEARVRFPLWNGEGYWYAAGDLLPLRGWEELRVFDAALTKLEVDAGAREELGRERKRALAGGCPEHSIGLLSRLWAARPFGLERVLGQDPSILIAEAPRPWPLLSFPAPPEVLIARVPAADIAPAQLPDPRSKRQRKMAAYRERLAAAKAAKQIRDQQPAGQWRITYVGDVPTGAFSKFTSVHVGEEVARLLVGQSDWMVFDPDGNEVTLGERLQDRASETMARSDFLPMTAPRDETTEPHGEALGETFDALPPGNAEVDW